MSIPDRTMRWWGWGDPGHHGGLPVPALPLLQAEVGLGTPPPRPTLDEVLLPDVALPATVRDRLVAAVGADAVRDDRESRVLHAGGKSYPNLMRLRTGDASTAPDAVVSPATSEQVRAVLEVCAEAGVAVVPFGGGTSVVGGVDALRGTFGAVISLDLGRLDAVRTVDERSLLAVVEPGLRGPELEAALGDRGLTLGHFPQSFEYASVGGMVATRSSGQASTGYGRIDANVLGLRCVTPTVDVVASTVPGTAAGPDLRELLMGSEGTLGVLTEMTLRVRRAPDEKRYEGFMFPSFAAGSEALRVLAQEGVTPDVARLSDEEETRVSLTIADDGGLKSQLGRRYLDLRNVSGGALAIVGWEDTVERVGRRRDATVDVLKRYGAIGLGRTAGNAWEQGRFHGPYLRDDLLDRGVMVDTLETATTWSNLFTLYRAVDAALRERAAVVMCHVSHIYPGGASLYFTLFARQDAEDPIGQWHRTKVAAGEAIVARGGTITHHHGVGVDHAPWMGAEIGDGGGRVLHAVKAELDPAGIMNPGKLLPGA